MNNTDEIELRKWCLEFISKDNLFESTEDLVEAASGVLNWIRGGEVKSYGEHTYVEYPIRTHTRNDGETKVAPLTKGRFIHEGDPIKPFKANEVDSMDWSGFQLRSDTPVRGQYSFGYGIPRDDTNEVYHTFEPHVSRSAIEEAMKKMWIAVNGPHEGEYHGDNTLDVS